jgi:hypothetical protein
MPPDNVRTTIDRWQSPLGSVAVVGAEAETQPVAQLGRAPAHSSGQGAKDPPPSGTAPPASPSTPCGPAFCARAEVAEQG